LGDPTTHRRRESSQPLCSSHLRNCVLISRSDIGSRKQLNDFSGLSDFRVFLFRGKVKRASASSSVWRALCQFLPHSGKRQPMCATVLLLWSHLQCSCVSLLKMVEDTSVLLLLVLNWLLKGGRMAWPGGSCPPPSPATCCPPRLPAGGSPSYGGPAIQPSEPRFLANIRRYFADFPYLH
jgi:hypothetical protein